MLQDSRVRDWMNRQVPVLREEDTLNLVHEAVRIMGVHQIPVVDGKRLVGILRQQVLSHEGEAKPVDSWFAVEAMSPVLVSLHPDQTMQEAARLLLSTGDDVLPVTDRHGNLVGIVGAKEVLSFVANAEESDATGVHRRSA